MITVFYLVCCSLTTLRELVKLVAPTAAVQAGLIFDADFDAAPRTDPAILCREDEESEWGSDDEEPGVRHGEEFQVREQLTLRTASHVTSS